MEDPRVTIELINDGFHVQDPMVSLSFRFAPHRTAFVTDAMAATDCPDGAYKLGALDVNVVGGHARLVSNGAIAGSTLLLEVAVRRAVDELGFSPVDAVEAATLTPAKRSASTGRTRSPGRRSGSRPRLRRRFQPCGPGRLDGRTGVVRGPQAQVAVGRPVDEWKAFVYEHGHMVR